MMKKLMLSTSVIVFATTPIFAATANWYLQVGTFSEKSHAEHLETWLHAQSNAPISVDHINQYYVVKMGPLHSVATVKAVQRALPPSLQTATLTETPIQPAPLALHKNHYFVGAYLGVQRPHIDGFFTVDNGSGYPLPYNYDYFSNTSHTTMNAAFEAGFRWAREQWLIPAYALSMRYQHVFSNDIGGQITQYSMSEFTNYTYQWNVQSDVVLLLAKANLIEWHHILPYVTGGLGVAFNRTSGYTETALPDVTPRISPGFQDNTVSRFAYHVGAGIDWHVQPQLLVSLAYEYQDLGSIASKDGVSSWAGTNLASERYQTRSVMLGVNYLLDDLRFS